MLSAAKRRAKAKEMPFDIAREDITVPELCPVLGIPIIVGTRRWQDSSPTLDRINPALGYVKGNVEVISARANRIKNDASAAELELVTIWIRRKEVK